MPPVARGSFCLTFDDSFLPPATMAAMNKSLA